MKSALTLLAITFLLLCAFAFAPRPALAKACDANDAAPAIAAWTQALSLYSAGNYGAAAPLYRRTFTYFAACIGTDGNDWRKYNHVLWRGRAEAYYADSLKRLGQSAVADKWFLEAKNNLEFVADGGTARPVDVSAARGWISWIDKHRVSTVGSSVTGPCLNVTGHWGLEATAYQIDRDGHGKGPYGAMDFNGRISGNTWSGLWTGSWMSTYRDAPASGTFSLHTTRTADNVEHLVGSISFGAFTDGRTPNSTAGHDMVGYISQRYCP